MFSNIKIIFIKILILFFRRKNKKSNKNHFLVVSTTGFGDTIWGLPAINSIKMEIPDSYVAVLTSEIGFEVLKTNRNIDDIFVIRKPIIFSLIKLSKILKKRGISTVLIFHTSQRIILPFCKFIKPSRIIGSEGLNKNLDFILTEIINKKYQHEIERRLDIVREIGVSKSNIKTDFTILKKDEISALEFLLNKNINKNHPIICMHPSTKNSFKIWPKEYFIEVGNRLVQELNCQLIICGNKSEEKLINYVTLNITNAVTTISENLTIGAFAALLKNHVKMLICNDSGPMHLGNFLGLPTIAIFGQTDPNVCGPYNKENSIVIKASKTCHNCTKKKCREPFCLLQISPDKVITEAIKLFHKIKTPA